MSCFAMLPSFRNNWRTWRCKFNCSLGKLRRQIIPSIKWLSWRWSKFKRHSQGHNFSSISIRLEIIKLNSGSSTKHIIEILNNTFTNYQKEEELLRFQLANYAQAFPDFVVLSFVPPSPVRMTSITRFGTISMGGVEDGIGTMMVVDSIIIEVAIKRT